MTSQVATRTVTLRTVLKSAAFARGFKEAREGVPMDYDAYSETHETANRWGYERGRQFALIYAGPVKKGKTVTHDAIAYYGRAVYLNWVR